MINIPSLLGTRADGLVDLVMISFVLVLPALIWSWRAVRSGKYQHHKHMQLTLFGVLFVAVSIFEADLKMAGGIFELTKESSMAGSLLLNVVIWGHSIAAMLTSVVWIVLVVLSLIKFDRIAKPNSFSSTHRVLGRSGMIGMIFTGLSAIPMYYLGFIV